MFTICPLLYIFLKSWTKNPGSTALSPPDVHTNKASKTLKVVLLHLWRINVKTTRGFLNIPLEDFHVDKTAP